ncbi:helix-turn-helix domain-containing protein [Rhodoblastus acidophilus]|jgi:transcriptional regulator with XRE-family HTH domain|uniref:Helix-turn-helix domain-containing protein n=2 Tax=Rhodoblastus acidophilus TaxID=1074 RepID=A0A6N8DL07_RHOAC|nr:helix-turn-helix transcriptional regulator [Rhodoblastus acidophilus]MCW2274286.1 transcriptional regulator with XRE-family HTH domain [Rhodoblastus acidophilus]MTV31260.1 helix-turn-helix domain-containing protein [Rhodoblastus acidophilus]
MSSNDLNQVDRMVGGHLEAARRRAGLSVIGVCAAIGVDEIRYRRFETGRERIDAVSLQRICRLLGVSPLDFFDTLSEFRADVEDRPRWMC